MVDRRLHASGGEPSGDAIPADSKLSAALSLRISRPEMGGDGIDELGEARTKINGHERSVIIMIASASAPAAGSAG